MTKPFRNADGSFTLIEERPQLTASMQVDKPLRVLSVIPPMTQLNTPYPSTAYLTGFLRSRGVDAVQEDLALALVLRLFSTEGLLEIRAQIEALPERKTHAGSCRHIPFAQFDPLPVDASTTPVIGQLSTGARFDRRPPHMLP